MTNVYRDSVGMAIIAAALIGAVIGFGGEYGGYPLAWDLRILEKLGRQDWSANGAYQGKTLIEAAPPNER